MTKSIILAIDAMGGDNAPTMVIEGIDLLLKKTSDIYFYLYGDENLLNPLLHKYPAVKKVSKVFHTPDFIKSDDKPSASLRQGKNSSMRLAIDAVANGQVQGVVSAGNTGAYMAMVKVFLRTIPGIARPAIAATFPTMHGRKVMLDLGANIEADVKQLVQFAIMGSVYAQEVLDIKNPTVGLLNVGSEEQKGNGIVQEAAQILKHSNAVKFYGFIEGDDIAKGTTDVVVTDGFTGNVALKASEGMVNFVITLLREAFQTSWLAKASYLLASIPLKKMRSQINPKSYNGAILIGAGGIAIKSHGGADGEAFAAALHVAARMASHDFNHKIEQKLALLEPLKPSSSDS